MCGIPAGQVVGYGWACGCGGDVTGDAPGRARWPGVVA